MKIEKRVCTRPNKVVISREKIEEIVEFDRLGRFMMAIDEKLNL